MKKITIYLLLLFLLPIACKNDTDIQLISQQKEAKKNETIFNNISKGWVFAINPIEPSTQLKINLWM